MGYTNVKVYRQGIPGWAKAGNPLASNAKYPKKKVPLVNAKELSAQAQTDVFILDTRPATNFGKGHIKGATNIDLEVLHEQLQALPKDRKIVIVDHKGKTTTLTGRYLISNGFTNLARLDGGFNAWAKAQLPVEK